MALIMKATPWHNGVMQKLTRLAKRQAGTGAHLAILAFVCLAVSVPAQGKGDPFKETLERAKMLKKFGQKDEALKLYKKAVSMRPASSEAHDRLGFMYFEMGDIERALAEMNTAVSLNPKNANAHHHLGSVYLRLNMLQDAADEFRTAMTLDPSKRCNCGPIERLIMVTPPKSERVVTPEEADRILSAGGKPKAPPGAAKPQAR